jgi:multiple sugar transport system substrate-binding protein
MEQLYDDVTSLYRLDQLESSGDAAASGKKDLGPLPKTSVILLVSLAGAWVLILLYIGISFAKTQKNQK